jgi:hypothetical protein
MWCIWSWSESRGDYEPIREATSSTWSPQIIAQVHGWLDDCNKSHVDYHFSYRDAEILTYSRFLDVNPEGKCQNSTPTSEEEIAPRSILMKPEVRLCDTYILGKRGISHFQPLQGNLTCCNADRTSRDDFQQAAPPRALQLGEAKTFANATHITRCFGFRYSGSMLCVLISPMKMIQATRLKKCI